MSHKKYNIDNKKGDQDKHHLNKHEEAVEKWGVILNKDEAPKKSIIKSIADFFTFSKSKLYLDNHSKPENNPKCMRKKKIASVIEQINKLSLNTMDNLTARDIIEKNKKLLELIQHKAAFAYLCA